MLFLSNLSLEGRSLGQVATSPWGRGSTVTLADRDDQG